MSYILILKSLNAENERIVLSTWADLASAGQARRNWRRVLGGKHWHVDRRPGLDTLDHLALTIEETPS